MQLLREVGFDFGETNTDKSDAVVDVAHEHADDKNEEFSHQCPFQEIGCCFAE